MKPTARCVCVCASGSFRDRVCPFTACHIQLLQAKAEDALEASLGFDLFVEGEERLGWLMTVSPVRSIHMSPLLTKYDMLPHALPCMQSHTEDKDSGQVVSAVDCYFMCQVGAYTGAESC